MFEKLLKLIKGRYLYLGIIVFLIIAAITARLFYLQIVNGKVLDYYATRGSYSIRVIEAPRGNIYDKNGQLIAYNRTGYNLMIVKSSDIKENQRDEMYVRLLDVFEKNGDQIDNIFYKYITADLQFGTLIGDDSDKTKSDARKSWLNMVVIKLNKLNVNKTELDKLNTSKDIFDYLRKNVFKIDEKYDEKTAYNIMVIKYDILLNIGSLSSTIPLKIATDISAATMMEIETRHLEFPGIYTDEVYFREYNDPETVSHVLGYVRAMSESDWNTLYKNDPNYSKNDIVGKEGIEYAAENELKGKKGTKTIYVDKNGREVGEISRQDAVPGNDIYLTIDTDLQKVALDSLIRNIDLTRSKKDDKTNFGDCVAGAVAVMDVKTGELLASVSYPDYDPDIFLAPGSDKAAQDAINALYTDTAKNASMNRVTQGLYAPGSAFKPVVALAALQNNKITPSTTFLCNKDWKYGLHCLSYHGNLNVVQAITKSCNIFFYETGVKTGINLIDDYAKKFGLGEKTGIEISEYQGYRSNEQTMKLKEIDLTHHWTDADTAQTSIGQLYCQFTPVQMVRYAAGLGTKGNLVNPHLIKEIVSPAGNVTEAKIITTKIDGISDSYYNTVKTGMIGVISDEEASIRKYFEKFNFSIAAKTGTPETGEEAFGKSSNGVFVCYAPADDPKVAISVVLERGVWGSNAAPVASDILAKYFGIDEKASAGYTQDSSNVKIIP